ncbi:MAG: gliding motility-associated C-terminal domain-containing protein [Chitinophagaceae bacterium]|nr:gliding motility-associated C-terminal domain-containing protein [Chitinophagaceae bacterium]
MQKFKFFYCNKRRFFRFALYTFGLLFCCNCFNSTHAQCPSNIDFETGTFNGWTCYTGYVAAIGGQNVINLSPGPPAVDRHVMIPAGSGIDYYGGFPTSCPNGSGYSIRLGNDQAGTQGDGISYEFTIPAGKDVYSLIYHYAVVFQDPNHQEFEQPRLELEIKNITDDKVIDCSSFTFIPYGSLLPGFFESPNAGGDTPVWCKDWTAVSINLNGHAGKTIRLFFKTADCTFRRHFGYAYVDVNSECSGEFVGATYCPDDTAVNVVAPYGYSDYTWYNSTFTQVLGRAQTLTLKPPPAVGTNIAVKVVPYHGYGCLDTFYAKLIDTLTVTSVAGKNSFSCNRAPVHIGANPKPGLVYEWKPATGLSNPNIANPLASPASSTTYVLTTRNSGGGCVDTDTVLVEASVIDNSLQLIGKAAFCVDSDDSAILKVHLIDSIQWYRDNILISRANQERYRVTRSGEYHAMLYNNKGCSMATAKQKIIIESPQKGIVYPMQYAVIDMPLTLKARQFGATVLWTPGINLDNRSIYSPIFKGGSEQLYTIAITTSSGCLTIDTQLVRAVKQIDVVVPNAFTPNNDGRNDFLRPILMGIVELRYFRIYNRWGQLLFESKSERPGWDGTFKGHRLATQAVVWAMEGKGVDGKIYIRKGTSILGR